MGEERRGVKKQREKSEKEKKKKTKGGIRGFVDGYGGSMVGN